MRVEPYPADVEEQMMTLYASLNEKDRRRYAAIEAQKLGYGGQAYIVGLFGCDYKSLRRGLEELQDPPVLAVKNPATTRAIHGLRHALAHASVCDVAKR